ncbi:hypothetical protein ACFMI7_16405, partial [Acinetobacter baumannii]
MITSSYFKKHKKNYRSLKDQQLTIAAKANIFICIILRSSFNHLNGIARLGH